MFKAIIITLSISYGGIFDALRPLADSLPKSRPEPHRTVAPTPQISESALKPIGAAQSIAFEDYSPSTDALLHIYNRLIGSAHNPSDNFSIAFLGDSFIEGDILTGDLRAELQQRFGGKGIGFVPFASMSNRYNQSIKHTFSGWRYYVYNSLKTADKTKQTIVGQYCLPLEGAVASYSGVAKHNGLLRNFSSVKVIFINNRSTVITITVNGKDVRTFRPASSRKLQSIDLHGNFNSVSVRVNNVTGFVGYGVVLGSHDGVRVDNYSVRGASGMMLTHINPLLTSEFASIMPYDVIVLQYGLNVASPSVTNYTTYYNRMISAINIIKKAYPDAKIILMGIGDRCVMNAGRYVSMTSIPYMIQVQRDIAHQTGSIFWDTYNALGGNGYMKEFVSSKPPLAARDYLHINVGGGRKMAQAFVNSLLNIDKKVD